MKSPGLGVLSSCPTCGSRAIVEYYLSKVGGGDPRYMRQIRCLRTSLPLYHKNRCPIIVEPIPQTKGDQ